MGRLVSGVLRPVLVVGMLTAFTPVAFAQVEALTLNINNSHFEPTGVVIAGGLADYIVRIDNSGNVSSPATSISFAIPADTLYEGVIAEPEGSPTLSACTPAPLTGPGTVTCTVPILAPAGKVGARVNLRHMTEGTAELVGTIEGGATFPRRTTVLKGADLGVVLSAPAEVRAGDIMSFSATVTNNGPYASSGGIFTIVPPEGLSGDITMPPQCELVGGLIECSLGSLPTNEPDNSVTFEFSSQVTTGESDSVVTLEANVRGATPGDGVSSNDATTRDVVVTPGTDVSLTKTRQPGGLLIVGDPVSFVLQPRLAGWVPPNAQILDTLPPNYSIGDVQSSGGWTCGHSEQLVSCTFAAGPAADFTAPITIVATAITATDSAGVTNEATIAAPENDGAQANNTANDGVAHIEEPYFDLRAEKNAPPHNLIAKGVPFTFTLRAVNQSNVPFTGPLTITDFLPEGLEIVSLPDAPWACTVDGAAPALPVQGEAEFVCTRTYTEGSPLPIGSAAELHLETQSTLEGEGEFRNGMLASFPGWEDEDPTQSNNRVYTDGIHTGDDAHWADLSVVKTLVAPDPYPAMGVLAGVDPVTFRIEIVNNSPNLAHDAILTDRLEDIVGPVIGGPVNVTHSVSDPANMNCTVSGADSYSRDLLCEIDEVPPSCAASSTCPYVDVTVIPGREGDKTNTAYVYSLTTPDPVAGNNQDSATYRVQPRTDVTVRKTSSFAAGGAAVGQPLIYVITASVPDSGLSGADDVKIIDTLPDGVRFLSWHAEIGSCSTSLQPSEVVEAPNNQIECNLGRIENPGQRTVTITVEPTMPLLGGDPIVNNVAVSTSTLEANAGNNTDSIPVAINPPSLDLVISKVDTVDPVQIHHSTKYTVTLRNLGPSAATKVRVTDILPLEKLSFDPPVVVTPPDEWLCTYPTGQIVCMTDYLAAGASVTFSVDMTADERGRANNQANVTSAEDAHDRNADNNSVVENTTVRVLSDVGVEKTAVTAALPHDPVSVVDLREEFAWQIVVTSHRDDLSGLDLAEGVTLTDTLPSGMVFTRAPEVVAGTGNCATSGSRLDCDFGDMAVGTTATVMVWVRIIQPTDEAVENTAFVDTLSFDNDATNDKSKAIVGTVRDSTIEGSIWFDFNDNGIRDDDDVLGRDGGVGNVTVTLTGIARGDNETITEEVHTNPDGSYRFEDLPPGTYTVSYTAGSLPPRVKAGRTIPSPEAATSTATTIESIVVLGGASSSNNDFTLLPQALLQIEKTAAAPVFNADGSYSIAYTLTLTNGSREPLDSILIEDDLEANGTNFGAYSSTTPPFGAYTVASAPVVASGALTGLQAGYTGQSSAAVIISGGTLGALQTSTITYTLRVNPPMPRPQPFAHDNTASAQGRGAWSEQTYSPDPALGNPDLRDSDDAIATPVFRPNILLEKQASFAPGGDAAPGQVISYTFKVTNTGNTPLNNVAIIDDMDGLVGLDTTPFPQLLPGQSGTRTATYQLTQEDIDNRRVTNTALAGGQWGIDGDNEPLSVSDDDTAIVPNLATPGISIVKEIDADATTVTDPTAINQLIGYRFTVENTGNTNLRNVVVVDPRLGSSSPLQVGDGTLGIGESKVVTATYAVTQADIDAGRVDNEAVARGTFGPTGNTDDVTSSPDDATIELHQNDQVTLTKIATTVPDLPLAGSEITWTVRVTNTGNVTLHNLELSEQDFPAADISPDTIASLAPGISADFTVTALLTQDHINDGYVANQAEIVYETPDGDPKDPVPSDDPGTTDPDDPTNTPLNQRPEISLQKAMITSIPDPVLPNTRLYYSFTITNTGNIPLSGLELTEGLAPFTFEPPLDLSGITLDPVTAAGTPAGAQLVVEGFYSLTLGDIEAGEVHNTALAKGVPEHGPDDPVTDDDEVTTPLVRTPQIDLVKSFVSRSGGVLPAPGDVLTFAFAITNTGNVTLTDIVLEETLEHATIVGTWSGPLDPGQTNSDALTATYELTQDDIDRGYVDNLATVTGKGTGPGGTTQTVTDDSGLRQPLDTQVGLSIVKSATPALSDPPRAGDVVTYSFVVTNIGNVTLKNVRVTDELDGLDPAFHVIDALLPGAANSQTVTSTYRISQADIQAGHVTNQAEAIGQPPSGGPITVPSNEIITPLAQQPGIAITKAKEADIQNPTQPNEPIAYSFVVKNTGNLELTNVTITDVLLGNNPAFVLGTMQPGEERSIGPITYLVTADDITHGEVRNQAEATGTAIVGGNPEPRSDLSGPTFTEDAPVIVALFPPAPSLTIDKSATFVGGDHYALVGDQIAFEFLITNTGNVPVEDVSPEEVSFTFGGLPAAGVLTTFSPSSATLPRGESQLFTASYVLTQNDLNAAAGVMNGVSNTARAVGTYDGGPVTSPEDTALLTLLPQPPTDVEITKSTSRPSILRGETVPFTIVVTNHSLADAGTLTITDRIPAGFVYVDGTAAVDGAAASPSVNGNEIVFDGIRLLPNGRVEITLVLRALPGTPPGRYINRAFGVDALGNPVGEGSATVDIRAEAVFDCSEVIGTVFNDLNGNGYQDKGEPGIPGVRLSTARGILVTTDEHGRYSIPCAALPDPEIGSNFVLKLDTRTLPTGSAVITDNPALARLTAGKMVEVNFAVALGREIKLTLSDAVFSTAGAISGEMASGLDQLVDLLAEKPARLSVTLETSQGETARARLTAIVDLIRQRWKAAGAPYALEIETLVVER